MQLTIPRLPKLLIACIFYMQVLPVMAQDKYVWPVQLQKAYTQTYALAGEQVIVLNRYGKMKVETWDRNEVKVEARISAGAQSNEYAKKVLDRINIRDEKAAGRVQFTTKLDDWYNNDDNGSYEMKIDLTVHIPGNAKLYAENVYGPLTIGDYTGEAELVCKYGTLTAGKLQNSKSITVEYGKARIESLSDARLLCRYSHVDIDRLSGSINAEFQYCNSVDMPVDNALKKLDLKSNYTSLYLVAPHDFSADYDIVTNNARLSSKNDLPIRENLPENTNARNNTFNAVHKYAGTLGKAGGTQINIRSNYGNIRVM